MESANHLEPDSMALNLPGARPTTSILRPATPAQISSDLAQISANISSAVPATPPTHAAVPNLAPVPVVVPVVNAAPLPDSAPTPTEEPIILLDYSWDIDSDVVAALILKGKTVKTSKQLLSLMNTYQKRVYKLEDHCSIQTTTHPTFTPFLRLPLEVKLMIIALIDRAGVHDVFTRRQASSSYAGLHMPSHFSFTSGRPLPLCLQINQELRNLALKSRYVKMFHSHNEEREEKYIYVAIDHAPGWKKGDEKRVDDILNLVPIKSAIKGENPTTIVSLALQDLRRRYPQDAAQIWQIMVPIPHCNSAKLGRILGTGLREVKNLKEVLLLTENLPHTKTIEEFKKTRRGALYRSSNVQPMMLFNSRFRFDKVEDAKVIENVRLGINMSKLALKITTHVLGIVDPYVKERI